MYMKATSIFAKQSIPEKPFSAFMFFQKEKKSKDSLTIQSSDPWQMRRFDWYTHIYDMTSEW